jgi:transposase
MKESTRYVGLDVHAETISVAVAGDDGGVLSWGKIPNMPQYVSKLVKKLRTGGKTIRACYEAGPCGYVLYWQLTKLGIHCDVVAPTLVPVKSGDRVKTDKRDAKKLARLHRAGELTPVWVPDGAHEALRDLVRAREAAKKDQLRARHRLNKFLLRQGRRKPTGVKSWTQKHEQWLKVQKFEHHAHEVTFLDYLHEVEHIEERVGRLERAIDKAIEAAPEEIRAVVAALQALRGVAKVTAATIVAEVGKLSRFDKPAQLMSYSGSVSSENSTGERVRRGAITKAGNAHLRRVLGQAAWAYRHRPSRGADLKRRQQGLGEDVKEIAWKAQHRLHARYWHLTNKGKDNRKVVTAIGRELLGFIWSIGVLVEQQQAGKPAAA